MFPSGRLTGLRLGQKDHRSWVKVRFKGKHYYTSHVSLHLRDQSFSPWVTGNLGRSFVSVGREREFCPTQYLESACNADTSNNTEELPL